MAARIFNYPVDTSEGRIERAIYIFLDDSGQPFQVKIAYLSSQMPQYELQIALDQASESILNKFCECDRCGH